MAEKHKSLWWGPPKKFRDRQYERKISWLELFYDLVYVATVGQLTHYLVGHLSWQNVLYSFLMFSLVFWSWVNGSQYYDLHGNDSIRSRIFTFGQMLAVAAVAITIHDAFEGHQLGFAISFFMIEALITYLWWSVGFYDPPHRIFSKYYTFNYTIALILIILSIFSSHNITILLLCVVLILNLTPSLTGARTIVKELKKRGEVFTASAALVERFGLFTIIVLAESVLGTVSAVSEVKDKHPSVWIAFILGILIAFLLWNLYFDMTGEQETKKGYSYMQWLIFLHFPLLSSICIIGACVRIILANTKSVLPLNIQWMFCISLAVTLVMIVGIAGIMQQEEEDRAYIRPVSKLLVVLAILITVLPLFGKHLNNIAFLSIISLCLLIPVFKGIRNWVQFKFFIQK